MKYYVDIRETLRRVVEVEANSIEEAKQKVKEMFLEKIINEITMVALELVRNTDMNDVNDILNSTANYYINDKYSVFITIEPYKCGCALWFTLCEDNGEDFVDIEEQDTADLTEENIRYNLKLLFESPIVCDLQLSVVKEVNEILEG